MWLDIKRRVIDISKSIANDTSWYLSLRKKLIEEMQGSVKRQKLLLIFHLFYIVNIMYIASFSEDDLKQEVRKRIQNECLNRMYEVLLDPDNRDHSILILIVDHLRSKFVIKEVIDNTTNMLNKRLEQVVH